MSLLAPDFSHQLNDEISCQQSIGEKNCVSNDARILGMKYSEGQPCQ